MVFVFFDRMGVEFSLSPCCNMTSSQRLIIWLEFRFQREINKNNVKKKGKGVGCGRRLLLEENFIKEP